MTKKADKKLGCTRALFEAIADRPISFFPRVEDKREPDEGALRTMSDKEVISTIIAEVNALSPDDAGLDDAVKLARESLDEVTAQTDYQDGKATRLLTILTFMSAFSGLVFNRLVDGYPLTTLAWTDRWAMAVSIFLITSYLLFAAFALLATSGALVTFHAIRSRFRYPKPAANGPYLESFLFWMAISRTQPNRWAKAFIDPAESSKIATNLKLEYLKNYVVETYLIGVKVADKVRILEPAQRLQSLALKVLFCWIFVTALLFAFVSPAKKDSNPLIRAVVSPTSSTCTIGGTDVSSITTSREVK